MFAQVLRRLIDQVGELFGKQYVSPQRFGQRFEPRGAVHSRTHHGEIEPVITVDVKSKASGEILQIHADISDTVEEEQLLVSIDPRTPRNRLAQAQAEAKAAESRRKIAQTQLERVESLLKKKSLTESDYDKASLELANAEAQVVASRVSVENLGIALEDTEIRAPVYGTIISMPVEKGQGISSPTQDVGGGTLLLRMADLRKVQVRALIDETDIGKIQTGMTAKVSVAAYPGRPFTGEVVKIEPQAVVEQNVTMFAVLISMNNKDGMLLPGMSAELEISIANREDVLTVPVMALRTQRDFESTASILGISEEELREQIKSSDKKDKDDTQPKSQAPQTKEALAGETITIRDRTVTLPAGISADEIRKIMEKRRGGSQLSDEERQLMQKVFRRGEGGGQGRRGEGRGRDRKRSSTDKLGDNYWVILDDNGIWQPKKVSVGVTDLDRVEVLGGLEENDKVLMLPSSHLYETQERLQSRLTARMGGLPGVGNRSGGGSSRRR